MGVIDWFKSRTKTIKKVGSWKELGRYNAIFSPFGEEMYNSLTVRSCVRPLASHSSKANAVSSDPRLAKILNENPNLYMNGKSFLSKVRTQLELKNTVFIYIMRDDKGRATGFYPVPYFSFEALEYSNGLYIKFNFANGNEPIVLPWGDLVVLRNDYNKSDIAGDTNDAILDELELINTTNQGIANAVKATANLRGILKSTKAMLSADDVKAQKERFVKDYLNLENEGGIASLDSTQEFTPITMNPTITTWEQSKEFREDVQRYFGVSDAIIMSKYTEEQMEAFYEARIEPFLVDLSQELTRKVFTERELGFGNFIMYESNRLQFASNTTKLNLVKMVDRGALTPNEWRFVFNLAPLEGGDVPIRRLDTIEVDAEEVKEEEEKEDES